MFLIFFFNDTATTEIYTLSLHDALPILAIDLDGFKTVNDQSGYAAGDVLLRRTARAISGGVRDHDLVVRWGGDEDRKSTRLNSSHANISYAVFCLKKKK